MDVACINIKHFKLVQEDYIYLVKQSNNQKFHQLNDQPPQQPNQLRPRNSSLSVSFHAHSDMKDKAEEIAIIYNKFCPYAQRALITAIQKELPAKFIKTGLGQETKTSYFRQTYSKALGRDEKSNGKVPILIHNELIITESELICWYLAEQFSSGSNLIPKDIYSRAKMRMWINQINAWMISIFDRAKLKKIESIQDFTDQVARFLTKVDQCIQGDYVLKEGISLADLMIYPWFERWIIVQHYFGIKIEPKYKKVIKWLQNMNARKSIVQTKKLTDNKYYIERTGKMMSKL